MERNSTMYSPEISVKIYLIVSVVFAALLIVSVVFFGSPVFNWVFGVTAIAAAFMAIVQTMLNQNRSRA